MFFFGNRFLSGFRRSPTCTIVVSVVASIISVLCTPMLVRAQQTMRRRTPPSSSSPQSKPATRELSAAQVAHHTKHALVLVETADVQGRPLKYGSGFFVLPDVIATNFHVIEGATFISIKPLGSERIFRDILVIETDHDADLALVKISGARIAPLTLGTSPPTLGERVYALGNPRGFEGTITEGIVSGLRSEARIGYLQFSASIATGSSGGPVVDASGTVVGVVTLMLNDAQNLNFAVCVSHLQALLKQVAANRKQDVSRTVRQNETVMPKAKASASARVRSVTPPLNVPAKKPAQDEMSRSSRDGNEEFRRLADELVPLTRGFHRAFVWCDADALEPLLANGFAVDGLGRAEFLRQIKVGKAAAEVAGYEVEEIKIESGGDAPVLTSVVVYQGHDGARARYRNRFVFGREGGGWRIKTQTAERMIGLFGG